MSNTYKHLIITRFNLRDKNWGDFTKNATKTLTDEWLKERFVLFTNYCFPSVVNQSNKNFEWWVYFDQETPLEYRHKIDKLIEESNNLFKPIFIDGMEAFLPHIQNALKNDDTPYVITSRLDNDDALHEDYVAFIQDQFSHQENTALDLVAGYTLQIEPDVYLGLKEQLYNPFITYIEKNNNAQSVWKQSHTDWKRAKNVQRYKERLWLSIIHDSNKVNDYTGYGEPPMNILNKFHFSKNNIDQLSALRKHDAFKSVKNALLTSAGIRFKDLKKKLGKYK